MLLVRLNVFKLLGGTTLLLVLVELLIELLVLSLGLVDDFEETDVLDDEITSLVELTIDVLALVLIESNSKRHDDIVIITIAIINNLCIFFITSHILFIFKIVSYNK